MPKSQLCLGRSPTRGLATNKSTVLRDLYKCTNIIIHGGHKDVLTAIARLLLPLVLVSNVDAEMAGSDLEIEEEDDVRFGGSRVSSRAAAGNNKRVVKSDDDEVEEGVRGVGASASRGTKREEISQGVAAKTLVSEARRQIRKEMKADPYGAILRMQRKPEEFSMLCIPLC